MLLREIRHLFEVEFAWKRPIERLHWELKHVAELQSHRDVVIVLDAFNLAPEDELLCLNTRLKTVQTHLDLHTLVQVKSHTIVTEVLDLFWEVQNVHFLLK